MNRLRNLLYVELIGLSGLLVSGSLWAGDYPQSRIERDIEQVNHPLVVEVGDIAPGAHIEVKWLGSVFIYRRTDEDIERLKSADLPRLADPDDANTQEYLDHHYVSVVSKVHVQLEAAGIRALAGSRFRSHDERFLVVSSAAPHSGCYLTFDPENAPKGTVFYDPCTSTSYDAAGRIFKGTVRRYRGNVPAKYNVGLAPYHFEGPNKIVIRPEGGYAALPEYEFDYTKQLSGLDPTHRLMVALAFNDRERARKALRDGADPWYRKIGEGSPLGTAILGSPSGVVRFLLKIGARPVPGYVQMAEMLGREDVARMLRQAPDGGYEVPAWARELYIRSVVARIGRGR